MTTEEADPSKLGTLEHWDAVYERELRNFEESGDEGEVWFGESVQRRVAALVAGLLPSLPPLAEARVLDVGAGNGAMLVELHRRGFRRLVASDYSANAVAHARAVLSAAGVHTADVVLDDATNTALAVEPFFDVVVDKGTYDAIFLAPGDRAERAARLGRYRKCTMALLGGGGRSSDRATATGRFFCITSCNFTRQELVEQFGNDGFVEVAHLDYPVLSFGGHTGSTYATVVFGIAPSKE